MKKLFKGFKNPLNNKNGSTLFEVIGGMALLLIFSTMLYSGIVLGGKFMSNGNTVQNRSNGHQTSIEMYNYSVKNNPGAAPSNPPSYVTPKTVHLIIGASNVTISGKVNVYEDPADEDGASTLAEFVPN